MFTETYIEMVTKAKEIQNLCKYNKGDWFWDICEKRLFLYHDGIRGKMCEKFKWLPTLEDLWNILHKHYEVCNDSPVRWGKSINKFIMIALYEEAISIHDYYLADMKEYLLYFVMRNVYNKSWNSDKKEWEERNGN